MFYVLNLFVFRVSFFLQRILLVVIIVNITIKKVLIIKISIFIIITIIMNAKDKLNSI